MFLGYGLGIAFSSAMTFTCPPDFIQVVLAQECRLKRVQVGVVGARFAPFADAVITVCILLLLLLIAVVAVH